MNANDDTYLRPILIGSAPSSGSTLLSMILDAHPDIFCGPELSIFSHSSIFEQPWQFFKEQFCYYLKSDLFTTDDFIKKLNNGFCPYSLIYEDNLEYYGFNIHKLVELIADSDNIQDFIKYFFVPNLEQNNKKIWAEKSPTNIYAFKSFLNCFPEGRVIYLIRDGRDVVCSLMQRGFSFGNAVATWVVEASWCIDLMQHPRFKLIRYEDLVEKTSNVIEDLTQFLQINPAVDKMLAYYINSGRIDKDASIKRMQSWKNQPYQPISNSSINRWHEELTLEQVTIFSKVFLKRTVGYKNFERELSANSLLQLYHYPIFKEGTLSWEKFCEYWQNSHQGINYSLQPQSFHPQYVYLELDGCLPDLSSNEVLSLLEKVVKNLSKYSVNQNIESEMTIQKLSAEIKKLTLELETKEFENKYLSEYIRKYH